MKNKIEYIVILDDVIIKSFSDPVDAIRFCRLEAPKKSKVFKINENEKILLAENRDPYYDNKTRRIIFK